MKKPKNLFFVIRILIVVGIFIKVGIDFDQFKAYLLDDNNYMLFVICGLLVVLDLLKRRTSTSPSK